MHILASLARRDQEFVTYLWYLDKSHKMDFKNIHRPGKNLIIHRHSRYFKSSVFGADYRYSEILGEFLEIETSFKTLILRYHI